MYNKVNIALCNTTELISLNILFVPLSRRKIPCYAPVMLMLCLCCHGISVYHYLLYLDVTERSVLLPYRHLLDDVKRLESVYHLS